MNWYREEDIYMPVRAEINVVGDSKSGDWYPPIPSWVLNRLGEHCLSGNTLNWGEELKRAYGVFAEHFRNLRQGFIGEDRVEDLKRDWLLGGYYMGQSKDGVWYDREMMVLRVNAIRYTNTVARPSGGGKTRVVELIVTGAPDGSSVYSVRRVEYCVGGGHKDMRNSIEAKFEGGIATELHSMSEFGQILSLIFPPDTLPHSS